MDTIPREEKKRRMKKGRANGARVDGRLTGVIVQIFGANFHVISRHHFSLASASPSRARMSDTFCTPPPSPKREELTANQLQFEEEEFDKIRNSGSQWKFVLLERNPDAKRAFMRHLKEAAKKW
jgi:hypothetical protein